MPNEPAGTPQGWIQGLCSSSGTIAAFAIAFLGYWAFKPGADPWSARHWPVVIFLGIGFVGLLLVPWLATNPDRAELSCLRSSRTAFAFGAGGVFIGIAAAILLSVF
jgi:hypothetical protein